MMDATNLTPSEVAASVRRTTAERVLTGKDAEGEFLAENVGNQRAEVTENASHEAEKYHDFWYAASVQFNCEHLVAGQIAGLGAGMEAWVPTIEEKVKGRRGLKKRVRVVLHSYVFFRLPARYKERCVRYAPLLEVKKLSKVHGLVMNLGREPGEWEGAHIPDSQIERLKFILRESDTPVDIQTKARYVKGDKVHVVRGRLAGLEGTVCRDDDGKTHLYVELDYIGYATTEILRSDVEYIRRRRGRPCKGDSSEIPL